MMEAPMPATPEPVLSERIESCRSCGSTHLMPVLDLGITPLADRLITESNAHLPEPKVPLRVCFCESCGLVQIDETVRPDVLFGDEYPYFSSVSPALSAHFQASAEHLKERLNLGPDDLVVEAASNDGYLLRHFLETGCKVLGVDPAPGPAARAVERGVRTLNTFFGQELAKEIALTEGRAKLFLANNVLAHVADTNGFVAGLEALLAEDGLAVIEAPYVLDLVDHCEFDTVYHQHLCYFSLRALTALFARHGLYLNDAKPLTIHGGSLRLFIERVDRPSERLRTLMAEERRRGADRYPFYLDFAARVAKLKEDLIRHLDEMKAKGQRIVGYGAAAKACTMLAYCGIDEHYLDYICDLNPYKQGKRMSGTECVIRPPDVLLEDRPDVVLVLAWNFAEEIMRQQEAYAEAGGRFLIPVPTTRVVP